MGELALAALLLVSTACPAADLRAELLAVHEATRQAHLSGDAAPIAAAADHQLLLADGGAVRTQTRAQVAQHFTGYFSRVRYREWRDASPPVVTISPDGQLAWMAVELEARYTRIDKPDEGEKTFKSSWIATYRREACAWRMTGMASNVVG